MYVVMCLRRTSQGLCDYRRKVVVTVIANRHVGATLVVALFHRQEI